MEDSSNNLICTEESYSNIVPGSTIEQVEVFLKSQALKDGFKLSKETSTKNRSCLYFACSRAGKPRDRGAEGKRNKVSKKIGNFLFFFHLRR